jgi:hypothetical protein
VAADRFAAMSDAVHDQFDDLAAGRPRQGTLPPGPRRRS